MTPASLWQIDRFFDEQAQGEIAKLGGLLSQDLGSRLFAVGAKDKEVRRSLPDGFGDPGIVLYPIPPPLSPDLVSKMFDT